MQIENLVLWWTITVLMGGHWRCLWGRNLWAEAWRTSRSSWKETVEEEEHCRQRKTNARAWSQREAWLRHRPKSWLVWLSQKGPDEDAEVGRGLNLNWPVGRDNELGLYPSRNAKCSKTQEWHGQTVHSEAHPGWVDGREQEKEVEEKTGGYWKLLIMVT